MLKSNFFRYENFNVFYNLGFEKIARSPILAPTSAQKNRISEEKFFPAREDFFRAKLVRELAI